MQNIYLVKKNYANPLEGDTKPPEGDNSMKFVYHQLNRVILWRHSYVKRVFPDSVIQNIVKFFVRNSHDFVEWTWAIQSEYELLINHSASKTKNSIWVKNNFGVIQQLRGLNFANL